MQVHYIDYRFHGGSDHPSNLVSLCAAHHLRGIHLGYLRVRGTAPDGLRWELADGEMLGGSARSAAPLRDSGRDPAPG